MHQSGVRLDNLVDRPRRPRRTTYRAGVFVFAVIPVTLTAIPAAAQIPAQHQKLFELRDHYQNRLDLLSDWLIRSQSQFSGSYARTRPFMNFPPAARYQPVSVDPVANGFHIRAFYPRPGAVAVLSEASPRYGEIIYDVAATRTQVLCVSREIRNVQSKLSRVEAKLRHLGYESWQ